MGNPTVTPLVETFHDGGFIVSVANGHRSIDQIVLGGGVKVLAGTVLGVVTSSGVYVPHAPAASDGSQNAAGILYATKDVTAVNKPATAVVRAAEVNGLELIWASGISGPQQTAGIAALKALGILIR